MTAIAVALGGALGALARYEVGLLLASRLVTGIPWPTLVINVSGAFALGFFMAGSRTLLGSLVLHRFVTVGFLGAFTTFSTFSYEFLQLVEANRPRDAALYLGATLALGVFGAWLGSVAAHQLSGGAQVPAVLAIEHARHNLPR
jgi:CrcB protein